MILTNNITAVYYFLKADPHAVGRLALSLLAEKRKLAA
jgi:hypothetical protein